MKNVIIAGCLSFFSIVAAAQQGNRVRSGNNLRWAMNGSVEIMEGDLAQQYGTSDSASFKRFNKVVKVCIVPLAVRHIYRECVKDDLIVL